MQPGGTDTIIETTHPVELMEAAVRFLFTHWKDAVVSNSSASTTWCAQNYYEIPFGLNEELFVYRNVKEFAASDDCTDLLNFIHLLRGDGELTVVMSNDSKEGFALVDVLKSTRFSS